MNKFFSIVFCLTIFSASSQVQNVSPYSRYALGDLNTGAFAHNTALGGATVAYVDSFLVNVLNPASYAFTAYHSPVFDVSMRGRLIKMTTASQTVKSNQMSMANVVLSMPFNKRWGTTLGLLPFSTSGYNINVSESSTTFNGTLKYFYQGQGGINRLFLGTAYKVINGKENQLSLGGNANFLFGDIEKTRILLYPSTTGVWNSQVVSSLFARDIMFDAGFVYRNIINSRQHLTLGGSLSLGSNINMRQSLLANTLSPVTGQFVDTVKYIKDEKGTVYIPTKYNLGFTYEFRPAVDTSKRTKKGTDLKKNNYRFLITTQYTYQDWTQYKENFTSSTFGDTLRRTSSFHIGLQFIPHALNQQSGKINGFKLINYRIGFNVLKNYLMLHGQNINGWSATAGLGIPLIYSASYSMLNISFEYGQRGTINNGLLLENYKGFHIGIAFSPNKFIDRWFIKRKYD